MDGVTKRLRFKGAFSNTCLTFGVAACKVYVPDKRDMIVPETFPHANRSVFQSHFKSGVNRVSDRANFLFVQYGRSAYLNNDRIWFDGYS